MLDLKMHLHKMVVMRSTRYQVKRNSQNVPNAARYDCGTTKTAAEFMRRNAIYSQPATIASEAQVDKDCTVRAFVHVTGLDYNTAHAFLKAHGREDHKGMYTSQLRTMFESLKFRDISYKFRSERKNALGVKLTTALPTMAIGRYYVLIHGHALAVVNGRIMDNAVNRNAQVLAVWEFLGEKN